MKAFLDTSVLVAAHLGDHPHHSASLSLLARADRRSAACAAHSLAEVYAVLTRLPVRPAIGPEQAMLYLDDVMARLSVTALDPAAYADTLRSAAARGVTGGRVYDALVLRCAEESGAEAVYTWNTGDFRSIAPELADRIRTP